MTFLQNNESVRANFKHARLLVVEDNDDYWLLIQQAIGEALPEVAPMRVTNRTQVQTLLNDWSYNEWEMPKLVLLDLYLPKREQGWQVLSDLRNAASPCRNVPVVMLSSSDVPADISEAYRRGASLYLVKPTLFSDWLAYFNQLRSYWWETVTLPPTRMSF